MQAIKMAAYNRITTKDLIHHSDRGLQYCSTIYQSELKKHNITPSIEY